MIKQAKLADSPSEKTFQNQIKTIKDEEKKQVKTLNILKAREHQQKAKSIEGIFSKEPEKIKLRLS